MKKVLAISGSTRASSTNLFLIQAIANLAAEKFTLSILDSLTAIPHFNPDLDTENAPQQVADFRNTLRASDGILICTPEYAMGVPGTLKNAIDWTVSSMEFSHKPVALITASSMGQKGHRSLLETLHIIEAKMTDETQLVIPFAKTKINAEAAITDEKTLQEVLGLIDAFNNLLATEEPAA